MVEEYANDTNLNSTAANQFLVCVSEDITMYTNSFLTTGVRVAPGGGSWSSASDGNVKASFVNVNSQDILARVTTLPIQTWNYKTQDASIRHIGPMAQDFYVAFKVGEDDTHIATVDADGIALAAIQGLNRVVQEQDAQIAAQRKQIDDLNERLATPENGTVAAQSPLAGLASNAWFVGAMLVAMVWVSRTRRGGAR